MSQIETRNNATKPILIRFEKVKGNFRFSCKYEIYRNKQIHRNVKLSILLYCMYSLFTR